MQIQLEILLQRPELLSNASCPLARRFDKLIVIVATSSKLK
jgi:hypothetical protein